MIGINILLNQPVTDSILQDLGTHGQVLDVISQINGVTLRAQSSELSTIVDTRGGSALIRVNGGVFQEVFADPEARVVADIVL
jgi:hypothetical protein